MKTPQDLPKTEESIKPFQLYQVTDGSLEKQVTGNTLSIQLLQCFHTQKLAIAHIKDPSFIKAMRDAGKESAEFAILNTSQQFCLRPITIYKIDKL